MAIVYELIGFFVQQAYAVGVCAYPHIVAGIAVYAPYGIVADAVDIYIVVRVCGECLCLSVKYAQPRIFRSYPKVAVAVFVER